MKIEEYRLLLLKDVEDFVNDYVQGIQDPDYYLESMPEEEWYEQFLTWLNIED